jgi:fucose permease
MKGFAGLFLGWLVAKYTPWSGMVATISFFASTMVWALGVRGDWYLFTFALFGAGELLGAYSVNYILSASPPNEFRRNMVLANLLYAPTAFFGPLFGTTADWVKAHYEPLKEAGKITELMILQRAYQTTFAMCLLFLMTALLIALFVLPRNPRPAEAK